MLIRKVLYIINIVCALILACTYIPAFVAQDIFSSLSLLGYLYPFFLVINVCFIILWLFIKPRHIILPLLVIALRFDYVKRLFAFHAEGGQGDIKVLTYNLKDFAHKNEAYDLKQVGRLQDSVIEYIASTGADIVCFQDYDSDITWHGGFHACMVDSLGYNHFYYYNIKSRNVSNCAVYSKYPVTDAGSVLPDNGRNYMYIYADIKTPVQTVRVYNIHLASYMLGQREQADYSAMMKGRISDSAGRNIIRKLLVANKARAGQIRELLPLLKNSVKPVIIAGDFNDHPFSNTYRKFAKEYSDAFVTAGRGLGRTYNGVFPAYRIDYIFYKKSRLEAVGYESPALDYSDHYPVLVTFKIKRQ